jgi:ubiquinone/menaquinone biosynthesis C-methylase UbiE
VDPQDAAQLFDAAAATYDRVAFPFFESFGSALVDFAQLSPDDRVLDAGCGAGAILAPAAQAAGHATGIEISPSMAERAREAAPGADVVVGDAAVLPFDDGSFDVVISGFVIFFIADPTAALREWRRVLRPGGRIVLSTWASPDPRWHEWERPVRMPYVQQLPAELLPELGAGMQLIARFDEPAKVAGELETAGLSVDEVHEHALEFVFPDTQAWWDWNWSHATRVFLQALPDDARASFQAEFEREMQRVRDERGYARTYTALFSRATA